MRYRSPIVFALELAGFVVFAASPAVFADTLVAELRAGAATAVLEPPIDPTEGGASTVAQYNPPVDCSTNAAFRSGAYGEHSLTFGHNNCTACHLNRQPIAGRGDRPVTRYASFTLENKADGSVKYEVRVGETGAWKEYEIGRGSSQRFAWEYGRASINSSPTYYVRHGGSEYGILPCATPNPDIGTLYYFKGDQFGGGAQIQRSKYQPYRR